MKQNMGNSITNKSIISGLSWSFAEKILTEVMSTIISFILARLLLPSDYGLISLIQIFITITSIFVECGLGTALVQNKNATEDQISTIFYLNFFLGIILYIILFFAAPYIANLKDNQELILLVRVLAIKVPVASIYSIQHSYIKKKMEFKRFFFSSLIGTVTAGIVGVYMAIRGYGVWALVASTLIDQIMDCFFLFFSTKWFPKFKLDIKGSSVLINYGWKILVSEFIVRVYNQLRSLALGIKYTTESLAFDVKGKKFPNMAVELIDPPVARVLQPVLAERQDSKENTRKTVKVFLGMYAFFITPVLIGLAAISDNFIPLLLTDNWIGMVPYLKIYCIQDAIGGISIYDNRVLEASGKGTMYVTVTAIKIIIEMVCLLIGLFMFNDPLFLAIFAAIATCINLIISSIISKKIADYGLLSHIKDYAPSLIISTIMGLIVYSLSFLKLSRILTVTVQVLTGIVMYAILSILFNSKMVKTIKKILFFKEY